jgi:hypothetical protein
MITYRYINKNKQPSYVTYTLLIDDEDKLKIQDIIRIEKTFKIDYNLIDEEFLRAEAKVEIDRIMYELENPIEYPLMELPIEVPEETTEE